MQQITGESLFSFQLLLAEVSMTADPLVKELGWLTNSVFLAAIVTVTILFFCRKATKDVQAVPSGTQNFVEFLIEFLYGQVECIVGKKVAPKAFPLLATIFIFVLMSNWFGLLPGVGTIGFGETKGFLTLDTGGAEHAEHAAPALDGGLEADHPEGAAHAVEVHADDHGHAAKEGADAGAHPADEHAAHFTPLLRPATADMNMTLAMAAVFMLVWLWLTMTELGPIGFLKHTFAPKGGLKGFLGIALIPVFLFVGIIEIISIAFRPVTLSLRLFGNVYAGESLLHVMGDLGKNWGPIGSFLSSIILPLPFYFMELLVGLLQAMVFALLCAVYIQLSTSHDEEH
jgi:F-type H+-transporting ATPase subunit a